MKPAVLTPSAQVLAASPVGRLRGISSMATRQLLGQLASMFTQQTGWALALESVGGVDAARRVAAGEPFDVVFLASEAIDKLLALGYINPNSKRDLANSGVAVAVRSGMPQPDISTEAAVRQAVLAAPSLSYSTGPSGVALMKLFEHWGIAETIRDRIVVPPPGVPVGSLIAQGQVALGFQQLSELMDVEGITVLGPLPPEIQITTTFSAACCTTSTQASAVQALLDFMAGPEAANAKRQLGMEPA